MGHLFSHFSLLLLLITISHAAELTGLNYWNSVLPKTPMPNLITSLLESGPRTQNSGKMFPQVVCIFSYNEAASEAQLHNNPEADLFFLEKDLHPGKEVAVQFTKATPNAPNFISRSEADKLPFSSSKFSEILGHFKIAKGSFDANVIKHTLSDCEKAAMNEDAYCATSLESMVDFATSNLKTHDVRLLSTNVNSPNSVKQKYTIIESKIMTQNEMVACHMEQYVYGVFYCHVAKESKAYMVNLVGKDGDRVAAVAVCHMDTSSWNPKHLGLQVLKVQPGTVPVCHFIPEDAVVWTHAM